MGMSGFILLESFSRPLFSGSYFRSLPIHAQVKNIRVWRRNTSASCRVHASLADPFRRLRSLNRQQKNPPGRAGHSIRSISVRCFSQIQIGKSKFSSSCHGREYSVSAFVDKTNHTGNLGEESVVFAHADIVAGMNLCAALANNY